MIKQIEVSVRPEEINSPEILLSKAASFLNIDKEKISAVIPQKRSIDARSKFPVFRYLVDVYIDQNPTAQKNYTYYTPVISNKRVIVIGFGPAGMFAALKLIELGIRPIVVERGKNVQDRRRDIREINQNHKVNPDSNYCFGEGGAGAYSDGKLYTRSTKRGDVKKILNVLVQHGASDDILIDTHPHIGSNRLPKIVSAIRNTVFNNGGEIHFNSKVTDFIVEKNKMLGVLVNDNFEVLADATILATGHSARDIYHLLHSKKILIEPKPFAMGVRVEHPQPLINEIQYHSKIKHENLPAASYTLSCNIEGKGIYSFCMCPGGIIVPAATAPEEIVVNGMSVSKRNSPFANSGLVVEVTEKDWRDYTDDSPFSGLILQMNLEKFAFRLANSSQRAPAQKLTDFVNKKFSSTLLKTSYIPGLTSVELHKELPDFITEKLRKALKIFDKKMHGYYSDEAIMVGVESRTSSPIRIPRIKETMMHPEIVGLFPSGEGAGYAGGIVSAAIDGENSAAAVSKFLS
jgi:uncharacterized FAD-dependent dehydrogenase